LCNVGTTLLRKSAMWRASISTFDTGKGHFVTVYFYDKRSCRKSASKQGKLKTKFELRQKTEDLDVSEACSDPIRDGNCSNLSLSLSISLSLSFSLSHTPSLSLTQTHASIFLLSFSLSLSHFSYSTQPSSLPISIPQSLLSIFLTLYIIYITIFFLLLSNLLTLTLSLFSLSLFTSCSFLSFLSFSLTFSLSL